MNSGKPDGQNSLFSLHLYHYVFYSEGVLLTPPSLPLCTVQGTGAGEVERWEESLAWWGVFVSLSTYSQPDVNRLVTSQAAPARHHLLSQCAVTTAPQLHSSTAPLLLPPSNSSQKQDTNATFLTVGRALQGLQLTPALTSTNCWLPTGNWVYFLHSVMWLRWKSKLCSANVSISPL